MNILLQGIDNLRMRLANTSSRVDTTEDALCDVSEDAAKSIADIEDALCEISELIS